LKECIENEFKRNSEGNKNESRLYIPPRGDVESQTVYDSFTKKYKKKKNRAEPKVFKIFKNNFPRVFSESHTGL
jgi:hypothetical protein